MAKQKSKKLEAREQVVLDTLVKFLDQNGYPPTIREIGELTNIPSTSSVSSYLEHLNEKGYIERDNKVSRGIRKVQLEIDAVPASRAAANEGIDRLTQVPIMGTIAAGEAINIPESGFSIYDTETSVELSRSMLPSRIPTNELFALEVRGDSMIDALVDDGDIVILRKIETAQDGDMIAAWLTEEGSTTLKYFYREEEGVRLQPANPAYEPVPLNDPDSLLIQGKVVMVIRQVEN